MCPRALGARLVLAACSLLVGCGTSDLSRSAAEHSIGESNEILRLSHDVPLAGDAMPVGLAQGLWSPVGGRFKLAPKVEELFSGITAEAAASRQPAAIRLSVNGIADIVTGTADIPGASLWKEAQFTWEYVSLPALAKRFVSKGGSGKAFFRLFDDGWRLERVTTTPSSEHPTLSKQETKEAEADLAAESERRRKLDEAATDRQRQEAERQRQEDEGRRYAAEQIALRTQEVQDLQTLARAVQHIAYTVKYATGPHQQPAKSPLRRPCAPGDKSTARPCGQQVTKPKQRTPLCHVPTSRQKHLPGRLRSCERPHPCFVHSSRASSRKPVRC